MQRPRLVDESVSEREDRYRDMLGLRPRAYHLAARARLWSWLGPLLATLVGAVLRLVNLDHPDRLVFDETYYVKDAFTLDRFGFATRWDPDGDSADGNFARGDVHEMTDVAAYVVHGDVGKWLIALGMRLFGADNGLGWRFSAAVAGTLCVLLVGRIAWRLFESALLATTASGLLALEGVSIVTSRTALLDVFLTVFVLVGFWAVLRDRAASRARLARALARGPETRRGPRTWGRWWLVLAGVALGLAAGVKWSGFYAAAALGITVFIWELQARRAIGVPSWRIGAVLHGGLPAFLALVPATLLTYVASWFSWFTHPGAYMHTWAADQRAAGQSVPRGWLPDTLNSFWQYHLNMAEFHTNLDSPHSYQSAPHGWLLQLRPTSFAFDDFVVPEAAQRMCGADRCVQVITSVGNPFVWWFGFLALFLVIGMAVTRRDWRAGAILAGYAATYLPWLFFAGRTVFTFYTVVIAPFVVLALTYALGLLAQETPLADRAGSRRRATAVLLLPRRAEVWAWLTSPDGAAELPSDAPGGARARRSRTAGRVVAAVVLALVVVAAILWWPLWSATTVTYTFWFLHTWLPGWS